MHPVRQHRPHLPSRFAYLPLTPQELLRAYLEIVGVAPHDSYGAQVTYDKPLDLLGRTQHELACAQDDRRRRAALRRRQGRACACTAALTSCSPTATARPTPRAARAGLAYEEAVLQADLSHGTEPRRPVPAREYGMGKLRAHASTGSPTLVSVFDPDVSNDPGPPPPRYCWPPDRRMTTFALVHGAWHGAWCWERLLEPLEQRGHGAVAIDLPAEDLEAGLDDLRRHRGRVPRAGRRTT